MKAMKLRIRGISPLVSTILLTAVVISIGVAVWGYTYSVSAITQKDYFESTSEALRKIQERFIIENIAVNGTTKRIITRVYNYGKRDITINYVQITVSTSTTKIIDDKSSYGPMLPGAYFEISESYLTKWTDKDLDKGAILSVEIKSEAGNFAFAQSKIW